MGMDLVLLDEPFGALDAQTMNASVKASVRAVAPCNSQRADIEPARRSNLENAADPQQHWGSGRA
jgi:hypothetical protein